MSGELVRGCCETPNGASWSGTRAYECGRGQFRPMMTLCYLGAFISGGVFFYFMTTVPDAGRHPTQEEKDREEKGDFDAIMAFMCIIFCVSVGIALGCAGEPDLKNYCRRTPGRAIADVGATDEVSRQQGTAKRKNPPRFATAVAKYPDARGPSPATTASSSSRSASPPMLV